MSNLPLSHSPPHPLSTWWTILRICLEERLVYRGDFALGTLMRFLPVVTMIFLWTAVFQGTAEKEIAGYTRDQVVAYMMLTMMSRAFSSMPGLASGIAREVRDGTIKRFLIQPIDMIGFLLLARVAHKLVYYTVAALPFALVFYLCRGYFSGWPEPSIMAAYVASLLLAFLLGYFLEATLGMVSFWWLEIRSLVFIYMLFNFFFSGHMFPIEFLPGIWGDIVSWLPLRYLAYFPAAVFLGKIQGPELVQGLIMQVAWVVFFMVACRVTFHYGVKQYSAFGG